MKLPSIKCNTASTALQCATPGTHSFYALNKGENSGKPLRQPRSNCYLVQCDSADEMNYYFWLSWGLWQSKQFLPMLKGSVISFITIDDYKRTLINAARLNIDRNLFTKTITTMQDIEKYEQGTTERLRLLAQAKIQIFRKVLTV